MWISWKVVLGSLLWLPCMLVMSGIMRGFNMTPDLVMVGNLLVSSPMGIPLALACKQIHVDGKVKLAWSLFAILAPVTFIVVLFGGLLGVIAMVVGSVVVSLPAWLAVGVLLWLKLRKQY